MDAVLLDDDIASGMVLTMPRFRRDFRHDRATIGPRSGLIVRRLGVDPAADPQENAFFDDHGVDSAMNAPRSWLDRAAIVEFFHVLSGPSD